MKKILLIFALTISCIAHLPGQSLQPACTLKASVDVGICIDFFCIPLYSHVKGGTPPYQYLWFNGSDYSQTSLNYGISPVGLDTCLTLTVTDASGCTVQASYRYIYSTVPLPPQFYPDSTFILNDTITLNTGGGAFTVNSNDHILAQNFTVLQPPKHGNVVLNPDGTAIYTADQGWCGPDNFRYTATDTSQCNTAPPATVWLQQTPCAGIITEKPDCNNLCNGAAMFYQNGVLTPPLSYLWSTGSTSSEIAGLCAGPVSVTVTDALGAVEIFTGEIKSAGVEAEITGQAKVCKNSLLTLNSNITSPNAASFQRYWTGPGMPVIGATQFSASPSFYCTSNTNPAIYKLAVLSNEGCRDTAIFEVEVLPNVQVDLKASLPACPGDTLRVYPVFISAGTPPYHYSWSGPSGVQSNWSEILLPNATPGFSGSYYLTVTDVQGCTSNGTEYCPVASSCNKTVSLNNDGAVFCSGSDIYFYYYTTASSVDAVLWTGPNGFTSTIQQPILKNADTGMTGWYYIQVWVGNNILTDSSYITVAPDMLGINASDILPATDCFAPYDGKITLEMSTPPPYKVRYDYGNFYNVNVNPIVLQGVSSAEHYIEIQKNSCTTTYSVNVPIPNPPQIIVTSETCEQNNASIAVNSSDPFVITWVLPSGQWVTNQPSISDLSPGVYRLTMRNTTTNCQFRDTITLLPYLNFDFSIPDTPSCTSADGSLLVIPGAGVTPPVSYLWSNGFDGNPALGLSYGGYAVTLTDGDGCARHQNYVLPAQEACIAQITGNVYANLSCLCTQDSTTVLFPFAKVCATDGVHTQCTYANNNGDYTLALTESGQYNLTATTHFPGIQQSCTSHLLEIGPDITRDSSGLDFYFCGLPSSDLAVYGNCGPARPGFEHLSTVRVRNNGYYHSDSSRLTVQISPFITNPVFSPAPESYNPVSHTVTWKIKKLALYQEFVAEIRGIIVADLGETLTLSGNLVSLQGNDPFLSNNNFFCERLVTGSFDPNEKTVEPIGVGTNGAIGPADTLLTYTIHFQNTGTDTAFTVVIRDTLDPEVFDLASFRPLISSHPYRLNIDNGNILVFNFDPIFLPDSNTTFAGSQGYVKFDIRLKKDLPAGTLVANKAAIYFDYNYPVITNSVQNTIVSTGEPEPEPLQLLLAPNPSTGQSRLTISSPKDLKWINAVLVNTNGSLVRQLYNSTSPAGKISVPVDLHDLSAGVYFILVRSDLGFRAEKLVLISD